MIIADKNRTNTISFDLFIKNYLPKRNESHKKFRISKIETVKHQYNIEYSEQKETLTISCIIPTF